MVLILSPLVTYGFDSISTDLTLKHLLEEIDRVKILFLKKSTQTSEEGISHTYPPPCFQSFPYTDFAPEYFYFQ